MLSKLKKAIPAIISALLCVTMLLGITASAEKKSSIDRNIWNDTKALTNAKYNSKYIKLAAKYSEKDSKNTVTYDKSRMKKFTDKFTKAANAKNPELSLSLIDKESIIYMAVKDNNGKVVICMYGMGLAFYSDGKKMSYLSVEDKIMTDDIEDDSTGADIAASIADEFDFGISENAKGKIFKFKSEEKIYYYEEFENDYYVVGMLFNENGSPLAIVADDEVYCISFKTSVDDSEFKIPKGYKDIDIDDFYDYGF
ncbi:MAG: hypothetical protein K2K44_07135 [Oscillospiraceae bacterium]|nr:hypothetical protein [Oscillospiraceae bacterium]